MNLRCILVAGAVAIVLSGCSLNDVFKPSQAQATPPTPSTSVSREEAADKAAAALGGEVVGRKGEFLLCQLVDRYKQRTTNYYVCREQKCAGQELLAQNAPKKMTRASCLSACRKREGENSGKPLTKSYCVH
jgi:hypothetical protein